MRVKVRKGYHFIGKGKISHPPGTVFEKMTEEEAADQMWKLEILPSRKADEKAGIDFNDAEDEKDPRKAAQEAFNKENGSDEDKEDEDKEEASETEEEEAAAAVGDESPGAEDESESEDESEEEEKPKKAAPKKGKKKASDEKPKRKKRG